MVHTPSDDENRQMLDNWHHDKAKKGLEAQAARIDELERWAVHIENVLAVAGILVTRPLVR